MQGSNRAPDGSIVVCTRNRAASLEQTLRVALQQDGGPQALEIVVVDNGSSDDTPGVVERAGRASPLPVHYALEPRLGLSHARNRGVEVARGRVVLFLDDDAWPERSDWALRLVAAYADPRVAAAGGDLLPVWPEGGRPDWLPDRLLPSLGLTGFCHTRLVETHYPLYPWGANLSFRRERVVELGGFSPRLGRQGDLPLSGEETELCLRIERAGGAVVYVPGAAVRHDMRGKSLDAESLVRYAGFQGRSEAIIESLHFGVLRRGLEALRRIALLGLGSAGSLLLSPRRGPRGWLLARYKLRASRAYLRTLLG